MRLAAGLAGGALIAGALVSLSAPVAAQDNRQVNIGISGAVAAHCDSQPVRVLVDNGVVHVTQYLRCNHPGRYVIKLHGQATVDWVGTKAKHKLQQKGLDLGIVEFEIAPGIGTTETFTITPANPAAARNIADTLATEVTVEH